MERVSSKFVRDTLEAAEIEFRWSQKTLAAMRRPNEHKDIGQTILKFQPQLTDALARLESAYRFVKQEEKRLISKKPNYQFDWFKRRMATLASYTKAMNEWIAIGRAIGDGFAWIFYQNDRHLIDEHLKLQRQPLLPPNLGGLGEKLTLENMPAWDGKLLIYHGTTTFLRMGDISLIDLHSTRVAFIGELKTQRVNADRISVSVSLISGDASLLPKMPPIPRKEVIEGQPSAPPLPAKMNERLKRQVKEMHEAISRAQETLAERTISNRADFHLGAVEELVKRSNSKTFVYQKVDNGLLIGALRLPSATTLGTHLMGKGAPRIDHAIADAPAWVMQIMLPEAIDNSISLNSFGGAENLPMVRTCLPFMAWQIDPDILADILFGKVMIVTFFNRAHLLAKLRDRGFEIETDVNGRLKRATKPEGPGKKFDLEHFDHFLSLVERSLMSEKSVVSMIDNTVSTIMDLCENGPARIEFRTRIA
jgi:hypothetical protein